MQDLWTAQEAAGVVVAEEPEAVEMVEQERAEEDLLDGWTSLTWAASDVLEITE